MQKFDQPLTASEFEMKQTKLLSYLKLVVSLLDTDAEVEDIQLLVRESIELTETIITSEIINENILENDEIHERNTGSI